MMDSISTSSKSNNSNIIAEGGNDDVDGGCRRAMTVNRKNIPLKVVMFTYLAGQGPVINYRGLFIRHLGITPTQSGMIMAIDRAAGILAPPALGAVSDKTRNPRGVLSWTLIIGALISASALMIRPQRPRLGESYCQTKTPQLSALADPIDQTSATTDSCLYWDISTDMNISGRNDDLVCVVPHARYVPANNSEDTLVRDALQSCNAATGHPNALALTPYLRDTNARLFYVGYCVVDPNEQRTRPAATVENGTIVRIAARERSYLGYADMDRTRTEGGGIAGDLCLFTMSDVDADWATMYGSTFWIFLFVNCTMLISVLSAGGLVDSFVINSLPANKRHNFGMQRLWGAVGFGSATLLAGFLKDQLAAGGGTNVSFLPVFLAPAFFWSILCVTVKVADGKESAAREDVERFRFANVKLILLDVRVAMFLWLATMVGYSIGLPESFAFWLAEERLHASSSVLGASIGLSSALDVIMYTVCGRLLKSFGTDAVMSVGLLVLAIKLLCYTLVTEVWQFVLVESMRGIAWAATWVAICHHATVVAPSGLAATTMGLVSGCTFGIGYGAGSLFGGIMFQQWGGNAMFRFSFVITAVTAVVYFVFFNWQRRRDQRLKSRQQQRGDDDGCEASRKFVDVNHNCDGLAENVDIPLRDMIKKDESNRSRDGNIHDGSEESLELTV